MVVVGFPQAGGTGLKHQPGQRRVTLGAERLHEVGGGRVGVTILATGATGRIGRHFVDQLVQRGAETRGSRLNRASSQLVSYRAFADRKVIQKWRFT